MKGLAKTSLRPSGYKALPRKHVDLRRLAEVHCRDALATVVRLMRNKEVNPLVRLKAAEIVLERGFGKATQRVDVSVEHRLQQFTDAELREHIQQLARDIKDKSALPAIEGELIE